MRLGELLENLSDSTNVRVIKDGEIISVYDGRDSIPTEHNDLFIEENGIRVNNNWLEINCYE